MESSSAKTGSEVKAPSLWGSCRLTLLIFCFFGSFQMMILRFNISMAVVCMVSTNATGQAEAEFDWDKDIQTSILAAFFYGYISTQILGGWISDRFGGKMVLFLGVGVLSLGSIVTPWLARLDYRYIVLVRIIQGLATGLAFPSIYTLFNDWSSPKERATLMSVAFAGVPTACVANFPVMSLLCQSGIDGGWPMTFYVPGKPKPSSF